MKYIFICLIFSLHSCDEKSSLHPELEKVIQQYQSKIPIPQSTDLKNYVFMYEVNFSLKNKDTIIRIVRLPSGIPKNSSCYGIYQTEKIKQVVIYDEKKLGEKFIEQKVRNIALQKYQLSEKKKHYADYPPVYSYKVSGVKINLVKIDTISDNWIK